MNFSGGPWRWLVDEPLAGVENMARDEALLQAVGAGLSPPTLRFYAWSPPTISLGYFQRYADYEALPPPASELAVVRRQTGGGAILHDRELTYALVLPLRHPFILQNGLNALYDHVHNSFMAWLTGHGVPITKGPRCTGGNSQRGPFFCFERHCCFDLISQERKLLGSAQRRTPQAVLQHGSLVLERRFDQQISAAVSDHASFPLEEELSRLVTFITGHAHLRHGEYTTQEIEALPTLRAKYGGEAWNRMR